MRNFIGNYLSIKYPIYFTSLTPSIRSLPTTFMSMPTKGDFSIIPSFFAINSNLHIALSTPE